MKIKTFLESVSTDTNGYSVSFTNYIIVYSYKIVLYQKKRFMNLKLCIDREIDYFPPIWMLCHLCYIISLELILQASILRGGDFEQLW